MNLFEKRRGPFYDLWETASGRLRSRVRRQRLADYLRLARQVPFYKGRLGNADLKAEHPLAGVPVLSSDDLRALVPPKSRRLLTRPGEAFTVFQSGGTTGFPKSALFASEEIDGLDLPNARGFYAVGLKPSDRVANLWAAGSLYMTFIHINRMLQGYGCASFPLSNHAAPEFTAMVARLFKTNCVTGISSVVLNALRALSGPGARSLRIEKVYYGGEHLYEADKEWLRHTFGTKVIAAPGYGTIDSWYIGYQCLRCPTGVFHCHDDQCLLEIVDEETGRATGPGETGMAYATAFPRRLTPIVRYRVGDLAQWVASPCPCGRTTPLFKLLGRGDDVLRIGFDSIAYGQVVECVAEVRGLSGSVLMRKERRNGRDRLAVEVETEAPVSAQGRLAAEVLRRLLVQRPTLAKAVAAGEVQPPLVRCARPGSLPRNPRTGKLVRVQDSV
ncbi:MAG: hypothetical protein WC943_08875 [Elusimicrobiota bacterium]|jgi:phenylacetate-coenzyme A ligase PaaK-like adenylate-forming protein